MAKSSEKKLKITLVKSTIGAIPKQVATVKSMGFNLSALNANTDGIWLASHGSTNRCYYYNNNTEEEVVDDCSDSHVSSLSSKEWQINFSYGTVKGTSLCSTQRPTTPWYNNNNTFTSDHFATTLTDETGQQDAQYCWCKPTGYDNGNTGNFSPVAASSWVFTSNRGDAEYCAFNCATDCAFKGLFDSGFRAALFGVSQ